MTEAQTEEATTEIKEGRFGENPGDTTEKPLKDVFSVLVAGQCPECKIGTIIPDEHAAMRVFASGAEPFIFECPRCKKFVLCRPMQKWVIDFARLIQQKIQQSMAKETAGLVDAFGKQLKAKE